LEELALDYRLVMLPFPPRVLAKAYREINPLGTIPFLIDGETRMSESAAMVQYLIARYGPGEIGVEPDDPVYGAYLNFLHQGEATLTFPQTLVLRYSLQEPAERRQPGCGPRSIRFSLNGRSCSAIGSPARTSRSATPCCWRPV
jgi:glutathione S-transferase